ncbi:MAG TPA: MBL fold metallo-hydrolase, partial [Stenotrophomonas sp.]|nr:MBL fold metallo-hydrolase [Stenotrophomonas sp.]
MHLDVLPFLHASSNTFSYLVADPHSGQAAVIDPALDFDPHTGQVGTAPAQALVDAAAARGWTVHWLLETHAHADHVSAAQWLRRAWPQARLGIGAGIVEVQRAFAGQFRLPADYRDDGSQFDHLFADGERFMLGEVPVEVIAVPGHTSDSVAYLIGDALFPGDSIFMPDGGTARCDFPGGDAAQLYRSIQRLFALPDQTRVFVCHDYGPGGRPLAHVSTIAEQRQANVHVQQGVQEAEFV